MDQHSSFHWLLIAGVCALVLVPFLWFGNPSGHDFEVHVFSWMNVVHQWKDDILYPRWADLAYWGYGEPTFLFYPPASWTLGASLGSVLPWRFVPGVYCWLALVLAAGAMYKLAKRILNPSDALFAAVFYAANPYFILVIYWRSAFAELLAAALLPLLLLFVMKLNDASPRPTLWLALILAAAWLTNIPSSLMIHYSAAGLALLVAVHEKSTRPLWRLACAVLLGAGLASIYLLPAIYEQRWINIAEVLSPGVRPQDNFFFTTTTDVDHNHFNQLISMVGVSEFCVLAVSIFLSRRRQLKNAFYTLVAAWGVAAAFFTLSISHLLWEYLPKFRYVQLPFRWLLCANVAVALLLTVATDCSTVVRWICRGVVLAALTVIVVVAGHRTQSPWWDTAADIEEMRQFLVNGTGYEGVDEYVPAGADSSDLRKNLPRLSDGTGAAVSAKMVAWLPTRKHFRLVADKPIALTLRLFNYPAWKATINGLPVEITTSDSGLIAVPVFAGDNDVQLFFSRTPDRTWGAIISLLTAILFVAALTWIRNNPPSPSRTNT